MKKRKIFPLVGLALVTAFTLTSCDLGNFFEGLAGNGGGVDPSGTGIPNIGSTNNTTTPSESNSNNTTSGTSSTNTYIQTTTSRVTPTTTTVTTTPKTDAQTGQTTNMSNISNVTNPKTTTTKIPNTSSNNVTTAIQPSTTTTPWITQTTNYTNPQTYTSSKVVFSSTTSNNTNLDSLDIHINYSGKAGISLVESSYYNPIEDKYYVKGDILPTWQEIGNNLGINMIDASTYSEGNVNDVFIKIDSEDYLSQTDSNRNIDLFYNSVVNINEAGAQGKIVDLKDYLHMMPNLTAFLNDNPTIKESCLSNGHMYYTPYFDGYNDVERMFLMDTDMVRKVLDYDYDGGYDTQVATTVFNGLTDYKYQPFIDSNYNYPNELTKVDILVNSQVQQIKINRAENIIKQQNANASTATGSSLRSQLRAYLSTAYSGYVGAGKIYENLSDIFVSESASYNADELIALMRVIKASPEWITGDPYEEIEILVPRGAQNSRIENIADFMQIWGIQGLDSEYDMLYFDENGQIYDAASTPATYQALEYLSQIYDEGLILGDFYQQAPYGSAANCYLNKYFAKTMNGGGYGFMMYDYSASTSSINSYYNGIGTKDGARTGIFTDKSITSFMPVLPPLTYWGNTVDYKYDQDLINHTNKTLMRYLESNRSLKFNSWAIPITSDNIYDAIRLMDYMYSEEGSLLFNFGPSLYRGNYTTIWGEPVPAFSSAFMGAFINSNRDIWTYLRSYIGSTFDIGHIRSNALNYYAHNEYAKQGVANLENAIFNGVVQLAKMDNPIYKNYPNKLGFASSMRVNIPTLSTNKQYYYDAITSFWAQNKCNHIAYGWAKYVVDPSGTYNPNSAIVMGETQNTRVNYTYQQIFEEMRPRLEYYLYEKAKAYDYDGNLKINDSVVPACTYEFN